MNGEITEGSLAAFQLGAVDTSLDAVSAPDASLVQEPFPTRPEGPVPQYSDIFGFATPAVLETPTLVAGEPQVTVDYSQLITRAGSIISGAVNLAGDLTDAITGRPTSAQRAQTAALQQQAASRSSFMPLLLVGGGLGALFLLGRR